VFVHYSLPTRLQQQLLSSISEAQPKRGVLEMTKLLLERAAPLVVDAEAVLNVVDIVEHSLRVSEAPQFASVDLAHVRARGLQLIDLLSLHYPYCFAGSAPIARTLLSFVRDSTGTPRTRLTGLLCFTSIVDVRPPDVYKALVEQLTRLACDGIAREAKLAARCLDSVAIDDVSLFDKLVVDSADAICYGELTSPRVCSALATLGAFVKNHARKFDKILKKLIAQTLVPNIILDKRVSSTWYVCTHK
jgi:hypothetical protein